MKSQTRKALKSFVVTGNKIRRDDRMKFDSNVGSSGNLRRPPADYITAALTIEIFISFIFLLQPGFENGHISSDKSRLAVIDLHRMQLRRNTPKRWRIKDVAGLHYSSMDLGLTRRDLLRFMKIYTQSTLRETLGQKSDFWPRVNRRAIRLYQTEQRRAPSVKLAAHSTPVENHHTDRVRSV